MELEAVWNLFFYELIRILELLESPLILQGLSALFQQPMCWD